MAKDKEEKADEKKRLDPYGISWDNVLPSGLAVPPGKTLRLSTNGKKNQEKGYASLVPKDIDDVKRWIGVPDKVAAKRRCTYELPGGASFVEKVSDLRNLTSADLRALHAIGHEYVHGDSTQVEGFRGALNVFVDGAVIHGAFIREDIDVYPRSVLIVGRDLRVLYARHIRIWEGGTIRIEGDARIDCVSIEGGVRRTIPAYIYEYVPPLGEFSLEVDHA